MTGKSGAAISDKESLSFLFSPAKYFSAVLRKHAVIFYSFRQSAVSGPASLRMTTISLRRDDRRLGYACSKVRDSRLVMIDMQCGTEDLFPVKEHQNDTQWSTEERSSLSEDGQDDRRKADAQQLHIRKPYLIGLSSLNCLIVTLYTTAFFSEILCCVTFCVFPLCCRARDGSCVYSSGYKHSIGDGDTKPFSP
jgi:hypothetical protein